MPIPTFKKCLLATAFTASFGIMQPAIAESEPATNAEVARTPNVVIIVADDLGHADAGFYKEGWNSDDISGVTKNIQKIAASGAVFNQGYVTAPVSGPSRAGLLTGRYQQRFGFYSNPAPEEDEKGEEGATTPSDVEPGTPTGIPTIGSHFQNAGYVTGFVGKLHDGEDWKFWPHNRGFDSFFGFNNGAAAYGVGIRNHENAVETPHSTMWNNYTPRDREPTASEIAAAELSIKTHTPKIEQYIAEYGAAEGRARFYAEYGEEVANALETLSGLTITDDVEEGTTGDYLTDRFGMEAARFINKNADNPFMLYVAFNAVHTPLKATEEYENQIGSVSEYYKTEEDIQSRKTALAMAYSLDKNVQRINRALKRNGLTDDTIIVFVSDNGGKPKSNFSSNKPLSGHKGELYEGGIRVPFAISWPGKIQSGQFIDDPVNTLDILPTVLKAAGENVSDKKLDGIDLMPRLTGEVEKLEERYIYWDRVNKAAVRDDEFKLIKFRKKKYELYKLSENPEEYTEDENEVLVESFDVSAKYPEKLEELKLKLAQWQEKHPVPTWGVEAPDPTIYKGEAETE